MAPYGHLIIVSRQSHICGGEFNNGNGSARRAHKLNLKRVGTMQVHDGPGITAWTLNHTINLVLLAVNTVRSVPSDTGAGESPQITIDMQSVRLYPLSGRRLYNSSPASNSSGVWRTMEVRGRGGVRR